MQCRHCRTCPTVATMQRAVFLTLVFVLSVLSPLAGAATTETQFKDGTTSYEHTFSAKGEGPAGLVSIPYGAEVTSASFNLRGDASTTSWTNWTTNSHYGGEGDTDHTSSNAGHPSPFTTSRRDNVDVSSETMYLKGNPTELMPRFSSSSSVSSLGNAHMNTTGEFVALSDQGYVSPTKKYTDLSVASNAPWSYTGVTVPINSSEIHIFRYSSSSMTSTPTILRVNPSTGQYLGSASYSTSTCGSSALYNIFDADVYNGDVYTAHWSYYKSTSGRLTGTPQAPRSFGPAKMPTITATPITSQVLISMTTPGRCTSAPTTTQLRITT